MVIYNDLIAIHKPIALALGYFDGLHRAHRQILRTTVRLARQQGFVPAVFTFAIKGPLPNRKKEAPLLLEEAKKWKMMEAIGIKVCYQLPFSSICELKAERFIRETLIQTLGARQIVCGFDHRFGKGAAGDPALLERVCREEKISCTVEPPVCDGGICIHSSTIREALLQGDICAANRLLGYPFSIDAVVRKGNQLGRLLGAPTINQWFEPGYIVPKFGVYRSQVQLEGKSFLSITNIGLRPTVQDTDIPIAETYILGFEGDLYGQKVEVALLQFLREEKRFENVEELKKQLASDIQKAQERK